MPRPLERHPISGAPSDATIVVGHADFSPLPLASTNAGFERLRARNCAVTLGADYSIRLVTGYAKAVGGDVTMAIVFISVAQACTQHVRNRVLRADDFEGSYIRDELRRPVAVSSIARSLDIPIETVRRKCSRLADRGLIVRTATGRVLVTSGILARPEFRSMARDQETALNLLFDAYTRSAPS